MPRPANEINPGEKLEPVYVLKSDKKRIRKHKEKHNYQSDSVVVHKALDTYDKTTCAKTVLHSTGNDR